MELKQYILPLRKWWWLIFLATLVAGVSSYFVVSRQPPLYQARTTLIIGQAFNNPNPTGNEFYLGQQLVQTYTDVAKRDSVKQGAMEALGLTWLPEYSVGAVPNSQLLEIVVIDTNPARATAVAQELANQVILRSPTNSKQEDNERQIFIDEQLQDLEIQIRATKNEIEVKQAELATMFSARQIADTQTQIDALDAKLDTLQANYAALLSNTREGAINTLSIFEAATVPTEPVGPDVVVTVATAAATGFILAAAAAYLLEYLDNSLKTPEDIRRVLDLPVIGYIGNLASSEERGVVVADQPRSPVAESFRSLRTNLEFAEVDRPLRTILVTSPGPNEGKTTVATNLAAVIAQGHKRVVLMDADLRRPSVHKRLGISNRRGLSDIFRGTLDLRDVIRPWHNSFAVVTSGSLPPNPAELLGSAKMSQLLSQLEQYTDMVVLDSPPIVVTDAPVLASKVDGVVMVVRPGHTPIDAAKAMLEQLNRAGARVVGVVMNRVPRRSAYYYSYELYAPYYSHEDEENLTISEEEEEKPPEPKRGRFSLFKRSKASSATTASAGENV